jgi:hypothetical protein
LANKGLQSHKVLTINGKIKIVRRWWHGPQIGSIAPADAIAVTSGASGAYLNEYYWTGQGADGHWDNTDNWLGGLVPQDHNPADNDSDVAFIQAVGRSPLIADGMTAVTDILTTGESPVMYMTGGEFNLTGWGVWWGDAHGSEPVFNMSGGVINCTATANRGILEIGWEDTGVPGDLCKGTWNMTGGVMNINAISMPAANVPSYATLNLYGGEINCGFEHLVRGGLTMRNDQAKLNICFGTLNLAGGQSVDPQTYEDNGWLVAFDGNRDVIIEQDPFDQSYTITAEPTLLGDANFDDLVNDMDASIVGSHWLQQSGARWLDGDFNGDGNFNDADAAILAAHWHEGVDKQLVPEPGSFALLAGIAVMGMVYLRRRGM